MRLLEIEAQGHLDLARAAYGFVDRAEASGTVVETADGSGACATGGQRRSAYYREVVVKLVLSYVVDGNIEAGVVGQIEDVEGVLQRDTLGERRDLYDGNIGAFLPGLAEDVALAAGEIGFESIAGGNCAA